MAPTKWSKINAKPCFVPSWSTISEPNRRRYIGSHFRTIYRIALFFLFKKKWIWLINGCVHVQAHHVSMKICSDSHLAWLTYLGWKIGIAETQYISCSSIHLQKIYIDKMMVLHILLIWICVLFSSFGRKLCGQTNGEYISVGKLKIILHASQTSIQPLRLESFCISFPFSIRFPFKKDFIHQWWYKKVKVWIEMVNIM